MVYNSCDIWIPFSFSEIELQSDTAAVKYMWIIIRQYCRKKIDNGSPCPSLLFGKILELIPNQSAIQMCGRVVREGMHSCAPFSWQELDVTLVLPCKPIICLVRVQVGLINSLQGVSERVGSEYGFLSLKKADSSVEDDAKYMLHLEARDKNCGHWMLSGCQLTIV